MADPKAAHGDIDIGQIIRAILLIKIIEAINKLPLKYQLVTKLYLLEGYDHAEISEILGIAVKTSRTQLRRGKLQLRKILEPYLNEARY